MIKNETDRHREAFEAYCELRNYSKVAEQFGVTRMAVNKWKRAFDWENRVMLRDQEIAKGVKEKMLPVWIETKAHMLKVLIEQVKKGRDAGVVPTSTRDLVAAVKEIRSIMGESDAVDVTMSLQQDVNADPDVLKAANELAQKLSRKNG